MKAFDYFLTFVCLCAKGNLISKCYRVLEALSLMQLKRKLLAQMFNLILNLR